MTVVVVLVTNDNDDPINDSGDNDRPLVMKVMIGIISDDMMHNDKWW